MEGVHRESLVAVRPSSPAQGRCDAVESDVQNDPEDTASSGGNFNATLIFALTSPPRQQFCFAGQPRRSLHLTGFLVGLARCQRRFINFQ